DPAAKFNTEVVAPNNSGAMGLEHAHIKVNPYYALLTEVSNHLPAFTIDPTESSSNRFNGKQVFVTEDSQIIQEKNVTEKQKEILEDYRLIQYDLVAGNQYSATWATQKIK
ncbi:LTA synthase family protein, partial [Enterococcus faecium]